ncbi:hypothetical protein [Paenibacillus sedimenti]|uniref:Uncharacterized protein n=1 Tax=Paenibacillus sedimenti TaxID=2770274 RepID=A0A926QNC8_9BACL|nr:hypothetical protein [Paenibacillus sedimenti]MBD0384883.1 hypothetical protein [Paenibacillus sedimenti]
MEIQFSFVTDEKAVDFCNKIITIMINHFHISEKEALGRINRQWENNGDFVGLDIRYHELTEYWAYLIYYGDGTYYWYKDKEKLTPIPFP